MLTLLENVSQYDCKNDYVRIMRGLLSAKLNEFEFSSLVLVVFCSMRLLKLELDGNALTNAI